MSGSSYILIYMWKKGEKEVIIIFRLCCFKTNHNTVKNVCRVRVYDRLSCLRFSSSIILDCDFLAISSWTTSFSMPHSSSLSRSRYLSFFISGGNVPEMKKKHIRLFQAIMFQSTALSLNNQLR